MARLPEQRLYDRLRKTVDDPRIWIQRVENGVEAGMPDIFCYAKPNGLVTWIETKVDVMPKRASSRMLGSNKELNKHQINWHLKCASMGGRSFILIGAEDKPEQLWFLPGRYAQAINKMSPADLDIASLAHQLSDISGWILGINRTIL